MANQNVRFFSVSTQERYDSLVSYDSFALYFVLDTQRIYKGNQLMAAGAAASETAAGLLSAEDYAAFKSLIANAGSTSTLTPVDKSVVIADGKIGVQVSGDEGNLLSLRDDGLFVTVEALSISKVDGLEERLAVVENTVEEAMTWSTL